MIASLVSVDMATISDAVSALVYDALAVFLPIMVTVGLIFWVFRTVWAAKR